MSQRAHRRRCQQTMVWAWLLLLAFIPQLVMKATHFHHAERCAALVDANHGLHGHHKAGQHTHDATTKATTPTNGTQWAAHVPTDAGQNCADRCDLCHYTPLWGVAIQPFAVAYDTFTVSRPSPLPLHATLARGAVYANALRGPPTA